jgi:hypothetical protein
MSGRELGFGKLNHIKPDTTVEPGPADEDIDQVGDRSGFPSREPIEKIVRRQKVEASANLNMRPTISVYNRFVSYAIRENLSYPDALKALMDKAGI